MFLHFSSYSIWVKWIWCKLINIWNFNEIVEMRWPKIRFIQTSFFLINLCLIFQVPTHAFANILSYRNNEWTFCITHSFLWRNKNAQLYSTRHVTITQNHFPTSIKNCLLWRSLIASIHKLLFLKEKEWLLRLIKEGNKKKRFDSSLLNFFKMNQHRFITSTSERTNYLQHVSKINACLIYQILLCSLFFQEIILFGFSHAEKH